MAKEAGDDDLSDVGSVGTAAGHTHHSEEDEQKESQFQHNRERIKKEMDTGTDT